MKITSRQLSFYGLMAVLIISPLMFGTVETWSYTIMELMIGISVLLFCCTLREGEPVYQVPGLTLLLLLCGWILLQSLPLPAGLVKLLSPEAHRIFEQALGPLGAGRWHSLSLHQRATIQEFLRFSAYVGFYWLAVQLLADHKRLKPLLSLVAGFGAILAFLVIVEFIAKQLGYSLPYEKVFWIRSSPYSDGSLGPYVNRNHYAGLMEMIFPLVLSLFLIYRPRTASHGKQKLADFFLHQYISRYALYGTAVLLIGTSIFMSLSRGGIISLTLSLFFLAVWLTRKTHQKKSGILLGIVFIGILTLTGTRAWDLIFERFSQARGKTGEINLARLDRWPDHIKIIRDFPLAGTGLGAFQYIYPRYRTFPGNRFLEYVHNDYIGFLATGGLIFIAIFGAALVRIGRTAFLSYKRRRERYAIYLFSGCSAALFAIALHSLVDFNLQIGANGLYFFFILSVAVSATHTRFRHDQSATYLATSVVSHYRPAIMASALCLVIVLVNGGILLGNYYFADYPQMASQPEPSMKTVEARYRAAAGAVAVDPFNPLYLREMANCSAIMKQYDQARRHYILSLRRTPLDSQTLRDAAYFLLQQGQNDSGEQLMRAALDVDPQNTGIILSYAAFFFKQQRFDRGGNVLKELIAREPKQADICLALMAWFGMDAEQMRRALPKRVAPFLALGDYLASLGKWLQAADIYQTALTYLPMEDIVEKKFFTTVYNFYLKRKNPVAALAVVQQALTYFPVDVRFQKLAERLTAVGH